MGHDLIDIQIDFNALEKASRIVSGLSDLLVKELESGLRELATIIELMAKQKIKEHGAIDLGQLWNSITIATVSDEEVLVGTNVSYAAAVEYGAKGHWIHIESTPGFRNWLKRHGIDKDQKLEFFYVTPRPKPYMEPAYNHGKREAPSIIQTRVDNFMKGLDAL